MKKAIILIMLIFLPLCVLANTAEDEMNQIMDEQMEKSGISELSQAYEQIQKGIFSDIIPEFNLQDSAASIAKGDFKWDIGRIINRCISFLFKEVINGSKVFFGIIALALVAALIENLQKSLNEEGVGKVAFFTCFFLVAAVGIKIFTAALHYSLEAVDNIVIFVNMLIPTTLTLLATSGAVASAGAFHPVMMLAVQGISLFVKSFIVPLTMLSTALSITDNISSSSVGRLAKLMKSITKWSMGIIITLFAGIISIQSLVSPSLDGVYLKTAKYAMGNFVPIVGGVLSETVELVLGCSVILKNSVGVAGLIAIVLAAVIPVLKLAASSIMFVFAAVAIEPVSDKRMVGLLLCISESITLLFACVIVVAIMFIIAVAIIISAGNSAAALSR